MSNPFQAAAAGGSFGMPAAMPQAGFAAPATFQAPATPTRPVGIDEVDFDSDIQVGGLEKFPKLNKDQKARVAFILFGEKEGFNAAGQPAKIFTPRFKMASVFNIGKFRDPNQVSFIAPQNKDLVKALAAKHQVEPRAKFGTVVLHYDTDPYGRLIPNGRVKLEAFLFGADKWNKLKSRHLEWGLDAHDLLITCSEEEFQRHDYEIARESVFSQFPPEQRQEILEKANGFFETAINRMLGFSRSEADIIQFYNTGVMPKREAGAAPAAAAPVQPGQGHNPFHGQPAGNPVSNTSIAQQAGVGSPAAADFASLVVDGTNNGQQVQGEPTLQAGQPA